MSAAAKPPTRVLVADDNEDHRFLIVRALSDIDDTTLEIEDVQNGEEALDYLYSRGAFEGRPRPHLVLLDLKMPRVSGLEVLETLKADDDLREIPVVVLTSSEREEDVHATYRAGCNSYVTKPSTLAGLRAGLEKIARYWTQVAVLPEMSG